jgi:hypothetical protein
VYCGEIEFNLSEGGGGAEFHKNSNAGLGRFATGDDGALAGPDGAYYSSSKLSGHVKFLPALSLSVPLCYSRWKF